jgi:hypothetical protein
MTTDELFRRIENAMPLWLGVGNNVVDRFFAELNAKPDIDLFDSRFSWMEPSWLDQAKAIIRGKSINAEDAPYRTRRAIAASRLSTSERMELILMVTR